MINDDNNNNNNNIQVKKYKKSFITSYNNKLLYYLGSNMFFAINFQLKFELVFPHNFGPIQSLNLRNA